MNTSTIDPETAIASVDLYSLIYPVKKEQFLRFGNFGCKDHQIKMDDPRNGNLQEELSNRVTRSIVKSMLSVKGGVRFRGKGIHNYVAVVFPDTPLYYVTQRLYYLRNFCGLTENFRSKHENIWYFESEFILNPRNPEFRENPRLRQALVGMLDSFDSDYVNYSLPRR